MDFSRHGLSLFGTLFATYMVLRYHTDGGPTGKELFEIPGFIAETFILLTSSFTSGLAVLAMNKGKIKQLIGWLIVTAVLGASFVGLEINEFVNMVNEGATIVPQCVSICIFHACRYAWIARIRWFDLDDRFDDSIPKRGITAVTRRKITIISLYWHFLDVVWIFLFTVVYLMGVM